MWVPNPPSIGHALRGRDCDRESALPVMRPPARIPVAGSLLIGGQSGATGMRLYLRQRRRRRVHPRIWYSADINIIAENGTILAESARFTNETIYAELDIERLVGERRQYDDLP